MNRSDRLAKFESLSKHPHYGRFIVGKDPRRLTPAEVLIAVDFIQANGDLPVSEFEMKVNRMFLDRDKPRHWAEILELLTVANKGNGDPVPRSLGAAARNWKGPALSQKEVDKALEFVNRPMKRAFDGRDVVDVPVPPRKARRNPVRPVPKNTEFGYPIRVERTMKALHDRIRILRDGIAAEKWKGEKLKKARLHLSWFKNEVVKAKEGRPDARWGRKTRRNAK